MFIGNRKEIERNIIYVPHKSLLEMYRNSKQQSLKYATKKFEIATVVVVKFHSINHMKVSWFNRIHFVDV